MQKKKLFKYALNKIGPTTETRGTSDTLLLRTYFLRFFKYVKIYFRALTINKQTVLQLDQM